MAGAFLDFNGAGQAAPPERDIEGLKARLAGQAQSVLAYLLPNGRVVGSEFIVGSWRNERGESLSISLDRAKPGVGQDFASGEKSGDLLDCWMLARGCDFTTAIREAESFLGMPAHLRPAPPKATREALPPPSARYHYKDRQGSILATVSRYDTAPGKKTFSVWDAVRRQASFPEVRPLYHLELFGRPGPIILVEGEKAADALVARGLVATSAMGGSNTKLDKVDWTPLAGRHVIIWPDADAVGRAYAAAAASAVLQAGAASCRVLEPPSGVAEGWDAADALAEGFDVEAFLRGPAEAPANLYRILDLDALETLPPPRWLLEGFLPQNGVGCIYGAPGTLKTFVALDWSLSIAYGQPWQGKFQVEPGGVLYVAGEGFHGLRNRVAAWRRSHGVEDQAAPIRFLGEAVPLLDAKAVVKLLQTLLAMRDQIGRPLRLVVIDTVARSMVGGDENSAQDMGLVIAAADRIKIELGCSVLLVHHAGKDESRGPRGSSALRGAVDALMTTERDDNGNLTLTTEKQKDAEEHDPIQLKPIIVTLTDHTATAPDQLKSLEELTPSSSLVLALGEAPPARGADRKKKTPTLNAKEQVALTELHNLFVRSDPAKVSVDPSLPPVAALPRNALNDWWIKQGVLEVKKATGLTDTERGRIHDLVTKLKSAKKIGANREWVWLL